MYPAQVHAGREGGGGDGGGSAGEGMCEHEPAREIVDDDDGTEFVNDIFILGTYSKQKSYMLYFSPGLRL